PRDPSALVVRFLREMNRMHAVRKCQILTRNGIWARCDNPDRRFKSRNSACDRAAARRHEQQVAWHRVQRVLDDRRHAMAGARYCGLLYELALNGKAPWRPMGFGERGDFR